MCDHTSVSTVYIYHSDDDTYTKIRKCLLCNETLDEKELSEEEYRKEVGM